MTKNDDIDDCKPFAKWYLDSATMQNKQDFVLYWVETYREEEYREEALI